MQYYERRNLARRVKGRKSVGELANLQQKRNTLAHRIQAWRVVQEVHMPMAITLRAATDTATTSDEDQLQVKAEDLKLFLPSSLPHNLRIGSLYQSLASREIDLRIAQADDALIQIRHHRRILMGVTQFRQIHVAGTGQGANTRMRHLYSKYQGRITAAAARYRIAHKALSTLNPSGPWSIRLRELKDDDIRGPSKEDDEPQLGEGDRTMSWIWLVPSSHLESDEPDFNGSMRVEWCKTQARVKRWKEEYDMVQEEMRRVLVFLEWKAGWWLLQGTRRTSVSADIASGLSAYAERQAAGLRDLASTFANKWWPLLATLNITPSWAKEHPKPLVNKTASDKTRVRSTQPNEDDQSSEESDDEADEANENNNILTGRDAESDDEV